MSSDANKEAEYLIALLISLQLVGYLILFTVWAWAPFYAVFGVLILYLGVCVGSIYAFNKKMTTSSSASESISDLFKESATVAIVGGISSAVLLIIGLIVAFFVARNSQKSFFLGMLIPLLIYPVLIGSVFIAEKI